ncbi:phosphate ABC transporter permease subunit PstC [Peptostreptococcus faecalis]|uniref:phosphate ABC transporter permease subunit PstC n=1 Tax=Peptostreptococcus faecalis TaxID=2045015 RepID=UPI000C7B416E|nr:phosphate ABC transporter permease subunit PstC [Peptostreptococcus faecalis]
MGKLAEKFNLKNKASLEKRGKRITLICTLLMLLIVVTIIAMVTVKGMSTFVVNKVSIGEFLFKSDWQPTSVDQNGRPLVGALPMILGSFAVTFLSILFSTPFAIGAAIYMVEISPEIGKKYLQPIIELLVGIPSVVYGMIGLTVVVPIVRDIFGGTGFGILSGTIVLTIMVLPTITSLSIDAIASVDNSQREASLGLGATRWQTIYKVVIRAALPGVLTAIVLGMARAFGEALAVQMVIGNTSIIPESLTTPASTLTSILTMSMGNTIPGQLENNVLWTLALILMLMSLFFIALIHMIGREKKDD